MQIIDGDLVKRAAELARPSIEAILRCDDTVWGSKWVVICCIDAGLGLHNDCALRFSFDGVVEEMNPSWGNQGELVNAARKKLAVAKREKISTSVVVATRPWCLRDGEFLCPGGVHRDGITVSAASDAKGRVDEAIAEILLSMIMMLAKLKTDILVKENKMRM